MRGKDLDLEESLGEEVLGLEITDDLNQQVNADLGNIVGETESLDDLLAINGSGVVVEELLVEVGGEGRVSDTVLLAEIRPGLQVLVVSNISDGLHGDGSSDGRLDGAHEVGLDAEHGSDKLVDRSLISVAGVSQVEDSLVLSLGGNQEDSLNNVTNVNGVQTQGLVPEALHSLIDLLVDGTHDETGGDSRLVARAIDDSGADNVVLDTRSSNLLLGLQGSLGQSGPGLDLGLLVGRFLYSIQRERIQKRNVECQ